MAAFEKELAEFEVEAKKGMERRAVAARDARLNAKAWEVFRAHIDCADLRRLGVERESEGARKSLTALALNALEAAEIFVKTVEE